jgi:hypothetical protein
MHAETIGLPSFRELEVCQHSVVRLTWGNPGIFKRLLPLATNFVNQAG